MADPISGSNSVVGVMLGCEEVPEGKEKFFDDLCVAIFQYFLRNELTVTSLVSRRWYTLSASNPNRWLFLNRQKAIVEALLTNPITPDFFLFNKNDFFSFSMPTLNKGETPYEYATRNTLAVDAENVGDCLKSVIESCELDKPKLHVYKSLKDTFTVAFAILLGKAQKHEPTQAEISFIDSKDSELNVWDETTAPHFPDKGGTQNFITCKYGSHLVTYYFFYWCAPESFKVSNFHNAFYNIFEGSILSMCAKRIEVLKTPSESKTVEGEVDIVLA